MKSIFRLVLFLTLVFLFSCEEQGFIVRCPDCTIDEPVKTSIEIKLDLNYYGGVVLLNVYEGNLEDSVLYNSINIYGTKTTVTVTLNKKYTLTAKYYRPGYHYIVIDSATPRVRYEKVQCDNPCYYVYDKECDLRLK